MNAYTTIDLSPVLSALTFWCGLIARAAKAADFQSEKWIGYAHVNAGTGRFSHCSISVSYPNGNDLFFSIDRAGTLTIALANRAWKMKVGSANPVEVSVDRILANRASAEVVSPQMAVIVVSGESRMFDQIRKGQVLFGCSTDHRIPLRPDWNEPCVAGAFRVFLEAAAT